MSHWKLTGYQKACDLGKGGTEFFGPSDCEPKERSPSLILMGIYMTLSFTGS